MFFSLNRNVDIFTTNVMLETINRCQKCVESMTYFIFNFSSRIPFSAPNLHNILFTLVNHQETL